MHSLRVNETKVTLRNAFISDHFALGGEKESKFDERTLFWDPLQNLYLSVSLRKTHIRIFQYSEITFILKHSAMSRG